MKASTRKKISAALKRYHACARRARCGRKKRRVALTQVKSTRRKGRIPKSRAASKGQQTAARMLRALEKKAAGYDKRYRKVLF